jgi:hypothetical protein
MKRLVAITDVISALAMVVWIGGHAALGAFAARIAFQELPRPLAASTMTRVFHEFDRVIVVCLALLALSALAGVWGRGAGVRSQVRFGLELGLCGLGGFEMLYVHPNIEALFAAGRTLEPAFAALHHLSERCAHGEVLLCALAFVARAWPDEAQSPS